MESIKLELLDNQSKILFILSQSEGLSFTEILESSKLSKNTVSKYLKQLSKKDLIQKILIKRKKRETFGYSTTTQGNQSLGMNWLTSISKSLEFKKSTDETLVFKHDYEDATRELFAKINDGFYNLQDKTLDILKSCGGTKSLVTQIGTYASKFGEKFFKEVPSYFLHLAVIYIFLNTIENKKHHTEKELFLAKFGKSDDDFKIILEKFNEIKIKINSEKVLNQNVEFYEELLLKYNEFESNFSESLDLIINGDYGINHLLVETSKNNDHSYEDWYFHETDMIGSFLNQKINDALTEELINQNFIGKKVKPLMKITKNIVNSMEKHQIIERNIKKEFENVVFLKLFSKSVDMGLEIENTEKILKNSVEIHMKNRTDEHLDNFIDNIKKWV
ncbi:MAG: MarR family transcriptional regulator [archaeon]|nr:MarR family transcriptional regulator [archaeon]